MSTAFNQENSVMHPHGAIRAASASIVVPGEHATIQSAQHRMMVRSKLNVRRKSSSIGELAALIRSQGLLQNLVGFDQSAGGAATGMVEIVAGGRRLEAVGLLIAQGDLPADYRIPYLRVTEEEAVDISLAENLGRADMHPADVFAAMLVLSERGRSIDDIALNFHVDALTVRRRLKLANVSPRLLAMYRDDEANFEQMMALAITDDHAAQEKAWDSLGKHQRYPHELRRLLTAQQLNVETDRVIRFVGVATFEKAGGIVTRDLFSNSGGGYISDAPLLEQLAMEKLEKERRKLAKEGSAWIDILPRADYATISSYERVRTTKSTPDEQQLAELAALRSQVEELGSKRALLDDEDDQASVLDDQLGQLEDRCDAIQRLQTTVPIPEDKSLAGAVISLDDSGNVVVRRDLIRPADKGRMVKLGGADGESGVRHKGTHSDRLTRVLTSHRTAALQAETMDRPDVALAVLTHVLLIGVFAPSTSASLCARVTLTSPVLADEARQGAAAVAFEARRQALRDRLPADQAGASSLTWLLGQPQATVMEFLAFCVANSLDTVQEREGACPGYVELGRALGLDMSKWWQPTAANYFHHVSKERTAAVLTEAVSREAAVPLEKMKKGAAAEAAERALANITWLPEPLRTK
jgi:ParB family chromosome partitioning protein